jgi:fermentation-respiration switch protein FrsA (DUF1100 family)
MIKNLFILIILVVVGYFTIRILERRVIFFPTKKIIETPIFLGLDFKDLTLTTSDGENINAWYIPAKNAKFALLFFHGNGGNLSHRIEKIAFFNSLGLSVFIVEYRGYGKSSGSPSEKGLTLDAQASYDYLVNDMKFKPKQIVIFGESLGGSVAIECASKNKVSAVILESPLSSLKDMAQKVCPFFPIWILESRFDSIEKIGLLQVPLLIIHSRDDEIVPFEMGEKLFKNAGYPKTFIELDGAHNDAFITHQDVVKRKIKTFLAKVRPY